MDLDLASSEHVECSRDSPQENVASERVRHTTSLVHHSKNLRLATSTQEIIRMMCGYHHYILALLEFVQNV